MLNSRWTRCAPRASGTQTVLFAENEGTKDFATEKHTKAPEGAATGATTGGVIGGVLGWLVGLGTLAGSGGGPVDWGGTGCSPANPGGGGGPGRGRAPGRGGGGES